MQDKIVDRYNSLILYRHLLVPMERYEERYPDEINPSIYEMYKAGNAEQLVEEVRKVCSGELKRYQVENIVALNNHEVLFNPSEDYETVERYFHAPKPSLETFKQILTTVRQAQGYSEKERTTEVDRVVELHKMLHEQSGGAPDLFFQPTSTK